MNERRVWFVQDKECNGRKMYRKVLKENYRKPEDEETRKRIINEACLIYVKFLKDNEEEGLYDIIGRGKKRKKRRKRHRKKEEEFRIVMKENSPHLNSPTFESDFHLAGDRDPAQHLKVKPSMICSKFSQIANYKGFYRFGRRGTIRRIKQISRSDRLMGTNLKGKSQIAGIKV